MFFKSYNMKEYDAVDKDKNWAEQVKNSLNPQSLIKSIWLTETYTNLDTLTISKDFITNGADFFKIMEMATMK